MKIRRAQPGDQADMANILNAIIEIGGTTAYQTPKPPEYFDRVVLNDDPQFFVHVAEEAEIIGFQWITRDEEGMGSIASFAKPGITGRGIGTALFKATLQAARLAGYEILEATIRADNESGLKYYTKMGFEDHSIIPAVPLGDGRLVDRVHKRLAL